MSLMIVISVKEPRNKMMKIMDVIGIMQVKYAKMEMNLVELSKNGLKITKFAKTPKNYVKQILITKASMSIPLNGLKIMKLKMEMRVFIIVTFQQF